TGRGVVPLVVKERPQLILLDIMLPDADGYEICKSIRETPAVAQTPIIFLTARGSETDRLVGLELGANDYIVKPFFTREVVARVRIHLRVFRHSYDPMRDGCTLTLTLAKGESVGIRIEGESRLVAAGRPARLELTTDYIRLFDDAAQR